MPLVKALCKKCYNENRYRPWDEHRRRDKETGEVYTQKDRTWHDRGIMFCVALMDGPGRSPGKSQVKVAGPPPQCCYYLVEQLLAGQKDSESGQIGAMNGHE